jgi:hypothetical protein
VVTEHFEVEIDDEHHGNYPAAYQATLRDLAQAVATEQGFRDDSSDIRSECIDDANDGLRQTIEGGTGVELSIDDMQFLPLQDEHEHWEVIGVIYELASTRVDWMISIHDSSISTLGALANVDPIGDGNGDDTPEADFREFDIWKLFRVFAVHKMQPQNGAYIRSFLANSHALTDIDLSPRELEESDEDFVNAMQSLIIAGFEDTNVSFSTHALTS